MKNFIFLFTFLVSNASLAQESSEKCVIYESKSDAVFTANIDLTQPDNLKDIVAVLNKNGYKYTGFTWKNAIWEVLNQKDFNLLRDIIEFTETADLFTANFKSAEKRKKYIDLICPILKDLEQLNEILKKK